METQRAKDEVRDAIYKIQDEKQSKRRNAQDIRSETRRETECTRHTKMRNKAKDAQDTSPEIRQETQRIRHAKARNKARDKMYKI